MDKSVDKLTISVENFVFQVEEIVDSFVSFVDLGFPHVDKWESPLFSTSFGVFLPHVDKWINQTVEMCIKMVGYQQFRVDKEPFR